MKILRKISHGIKADVHETWRSVRRLRNKISKMWQVNQGVFAQPINTFYGVASAVLSVLVGMWFANIGILQSVLESQTLTLLQKFDFMFSMLGTLFRNIATLQLALITAHFVLWCFVGALWLETIKAHNEHHQLRPRLAPVIIATLFIGAVAVLGISLITPVITRAGISVFVSDHFSGTILLGVAIIAEIDLTKRLSRLLSRASY